MFIPPPGLTTPTVGPCCATHLLSCLEKACLEVVPYKRIPSYRRKLHIKPFLTIHARLTITDISHFWWPKYGWDTSALIQKAHPGLITHDEIIECLFDVFWTHFQIFFSHWLHSSPFVHLSTNGVAILHLLTRLFSKKTSRFCYSPLVGGSILRKL